MLMPSMLIHTGYMCVGFGGHHEDQLTLSGQPDVKRFNMTSDEVAVGQYSSIQSPAVLLPVKRIQIMCRTKIY